VNRLAAILAPVAVLLACTTNSAPPRAIQIPDTTDTPVAPAASPAEIDVPAIKAHSTLIPLGLVDPNTKQPVANGVLEVPDVKHPEQAGYFKDGVMPCGSPGPAVVVGHVDGAGRPGVFVDLKNLKEGDTVTVTMSDGKQCAYKIYQVMHVSKTSFPTARVYGNTEEPEIRLITCGDKFVGGALGYANNIIAFGRID
jgi:LPXTG-site transpeptidase (sortase) family protein